MKKMIKSKSDFKKAQRRVNDQFVFFFLYLSLVLIISKKIYGFSLFEDFLLLLLPDEDDEEEDDSLTGLLNKNKPFNTNKNELKQIERKLAAKMRLSGAVCLKTRAFGVLVIKYCSM